MEEMLLLIIDELRTAEQAEESVQHSGILAHYAQLPDEALFSRLIDRLGKGRPDAQDYSKQTLLPYYHKVKQSDPVRWQSWNIDPELEKRFLRIMQIKPRRTASGVATITVITKPWPCGSDCLYCPNDLRMPKSYLADEPACQRAERNYFDPYLQVQSRLQVLSRMGHLTDKVEIIVLGGSWCDYPPAYQIWFVAELFRALNDGIEGDQDRQQTQQRTQQYQDAGISNRAEQQALRVAPYQQQISAGTLNYNQAIRLLYAEDPAWQALAATQVAGMDTLRREQLRNETAVHRMVGFTVETRPDLVTDDSLRLLRQMGVTRLQIGVQSLDPQVLQLNRRAISVAQMQTAFALARAFGFKIHAHFMQNLYGSTLQADLQQYQQFMTDPAYLPDEVKLYPCSLVADTGLCAHFADGSWQPYSEEELIQLLAADTLNTPPFVRISRMIRDISSHDIIAGSKRTNLRQMVEAYIAESSDQAIQEIRSREIAQDEVAQADLQLDIISYDTTVSTEHFLQWVTSDNRIAGFLRLSLPTKIRTRHLPANTTLPTADDEAMI
ncbi:MAG: radical SAM protein, partial [Coriobacteriia bacterium]|nr:radical SAM protein [Coriobacteriia bacterium]